ncbi:MAG: hypothetical protein E7647_05375 [Ruminococcaceae bacterium]|nr:hypothetical protein [Oscillospiraceae bacterium]
MYCIKCGVELCDGEKCCPLCKTEVVHPEYKDKEKDELYPSDKVPKKNRGSKLGQILLTAAFLLALSIVVLCDVQFNRAVTWSGFVIGALVLGYTVFALPLWFRAPNPVIFVPCGFGAGILYLLYIDLVTPGEWFLSFALPVAALLCAIVTCVVTLMRYVPKGRFYIFGGAFIGLGGLMLLCEFLMTAAFSVVKFIGWSLYPLVTFVILGGLLIFLGICRPARETMERRFFI